MIQDFPPALQALLDKQSIEEVLMRYSRSIDRNDDALLRSVYWPDAYDDHLLYAGNLEGLVEYCMETTRTMATHHFLGNRLIELTGPDKAFAETYYQAYHNITPAEGEGRQDLTLLGRYLDNFERRDGEWRISQRICTVDAYTEMPATSDWLNGLLSGVKTRGAKKPVDPLYAYHPAGRNQ
jgi:hypothetical protein